jgi:hypothetical protein
MGENHFNKSVMLPNNFTLNQYSKELEILHYKTFQCTFLAIFFDFITQICQRIQIIMLDLQIYQNSKCRGGVESSEVVGFAIG